MWFSNVNGKHVFRGVNGDLHYAPVFSHHIPVMSDSKEAADKIAQQCAAQWPGSKATASTHNEKYHVKTN
jgi:hypothetical protein